MEAPTILAISVCLVLALAIFVLLQVWAPDRTVKDLISRWASLPSRFVQVDHLVAHFRDEGRRDDPEPIVLIHGTSSSLHTWDGWVSELSKTRRVVRVDLPGFGLTGPNPSGRYDLESYTRFMNDFMSALDIRGAVMVGNSLGGFVAWKTALDYPSRVKKLVLIDSAGYAYRSDKMPIAFTLARMRVLTPIITRILPRNVVAASVREVYGDPSKVTLELIERYYELTLRPGNREAVIQRFRQLPTGEAADEFEKLIKNITCPTLIIWGGKDRLIPKQCAERFHHDIRGSQLVVFGELGHVPHEEAPGDTVRVVEEFLGQNFEPLLTLSPQEPDKTAPHQQIASTPTALSSEP